MQRPAAIFGSALFLVVAPGTFTIYIPWTITRWRFAPPLLGISFFRLLGVLLIAAGLPVLLDSFARFALQGMGTPAHIAPPQRLVVTGFFRFVRNPIYVAVLSLVFGQGLLFGSGHLLVYGLAMFVVIHCFIVFYEEPTLRRTFDGEYENFCAHVRRWIPRLRPWNG
jgi:protein-S-isoprenylcysteine O-methyltransferase Ste14